MTKRTALITGGAARIGAAIARELHAHDIDIVIHYRNSIDAAAALADELNAIRQNSADTVQGDLLDHETIPRIIDEDAQVVVEDSHLVDNASSFYATPLGTVTGQEWDDLVGTNMKAPFFLAQAAAPWLRKSKGCIINLVDVHAIRPKKDFSVYCMAKAANAMMIMSMARELGPDVRVNGVAPGAILWPEHEITDIDKARILSRVPLARHGEVEDIARTVRFLVTEADYITGQLIPVDGGRTAQQ